MGEEPDGGKGVLGVVGDAAGPAGDAVEAVVEAEVAGWAAIVGVEEEAHGLGRLGRGLLGSYLWLAG